MSAWAFLVICALILAAPHMSVPACLGALPDLRRVVGPRHHLRRDRGRRGVMYG